MNTNNIKYAQETKWLDDIESSTNRIKQQARNLKEEVFQQNKG